MTLLTKVPPTQYELKYTNRFNVEFDEKIGIYSWLVQKCDAPKFTDGKWEDIKIEFIDPIGPSATNGLYNIVQLLLNNQSIGDIKIQTLDPTGVIAEQWNIVIHEIKTINFGEYDYGNDECRRPYMIIKPKTCYLKQ